VIRVVAEGRRAKIEELFEKETATLGRGETSKLVSVW